MRHIVWLCVCVLACVSASVTVSLAAAGDYTDREHVSLGKRLARRGFPVSAARHYVEVIRKQQSPILEAKAIGALEQLIRDHALSPTLVSAGVLGEGGAGARPDSDFFAYLEVHRSGRESLGQWGSRAYSTIRPDGYWSRQLSLEEIDRLLYLGSYEKVGESLETLAMVDSLMPNQQEELYRKRSRLAYALGEFEAAVDVLERVPRGKEGAVDDVERAWSRLQLGQTGRALGLAWVAFHRTEDPLIQLEVRMIRALAWLDTCQSTLAMKEILELEDLLKSDVFALQEGAEPASLTWVRRFAAQRPESAMVSKTLASVADEVLRGSQNPAVIDVLRPFSQRIGGLYAQQETQAIREGAFALLEAFGKIQWLKHQRAFVRPGGPRPDLIATKGVREFSGTSVKWAQDIAYVQDGELWEDELATLSVLGEDRCE